MNHHSFQRSSFAQCWKVGPIMLALMMIGSTAESDSPDGPDLVTITAPISDSTVSGLVAIEVAASPAVSRIDVYINGGYLASGPPLTTTTWDSTSVANGNNTISVIGYSNGGSTKGSSTIAVNVANGEPSSAPSPTLTPTPASTPTPSPKSTPTPASTATPSPTPSSVGGLDQYGGVRSVSCPNGAQPHFYTQRIGDRWWICTPAGHGFFMKGVVGVNYSFTTAWSSGGLQSKYGSAYNPYVVSSAEDPADCLGLQLGYRTGKSAESVGLQLARRWFGLLDSADQLRRQVEHPGPRHSRPIQDAV